MFTVKAVHKTLEKTVQIKLEISEEMAANLMQYAIADMIDKGCAYIEEGQEKDAYNLFIAEPAGNS